MWSFGAIPSECSSFGPAIPETRRSARALLLSSRGGGLAVAAFRVVARSQVFKPDRRPWGGLPSWLPSAGGDGPGTAQGRRPSPAKALSRASDLVAVQ